MFKKAINSRFIEVFEELKRLGKVRRHHEFGVKLDISSQVLTEILGGRMNVSVSHVQKLCSVFNVNYEYLFEGTLPMFKAEEGIKSKNIPAKQRGKMEPNLEPNLEPNSVSHLLNEEEVIYKGMAKANHKDNSGDGPSYNELIASKDATIAALQTTVESLKMALEVIKKGK